MGLLSHLRGRRGEDQVAQHCQTLGWTILGRNLRGRRGEIDLLALDGEIVVSVEVRLRGTLDQALESLTPTKVRRWIQTTEEMQARFSELWDRYIRLDLLILDRHGRLEHLRNVVQNDPSHPF